MSASCGGSKLAVVDEGATLSVIAQDTLAVSTAARAVTSAVWHDDHDDVSCG